MGSLDVPGAAAGGQRGGSGSGSVSASATMPGRSTGKWLVAAEHMLQDLDGSLPSYRSGVKYKQRSAIFTKNKAL